MNIELKPTCLKIDLKKNLRPSNFINMLLDRYLSLYKVKENFSAYLMN